jgi:hypothetical protein
MGIDVYHLLDVVIPRLQGEVGAIEREAGGVEEEGVRGHAPALVHHRGEGIQDMIDIFAFTEVFRVANIPTLFANASSQQISNLFLGPRACIPYF